MLTEKDLTYKEKLPTKEEREKEKQERDKMNSDIMKIKDVLVKFINDEIIPLDIPISTVEEALKTLVNPIITIHKTKSKQFAAYLEARRVLEETPIKDLEYVDEAKK
jgi:hypothetical protein